MKKEFLSLSVFAFIFCFVFIENVASIEQKIGEEEQPAYQAFLRETTVILGQYQQSVDLSFDYKRNEAGNIVNSQISREFGLIASYHFGLPRGVEAYLNVPLLWKENINQSKFEQEETKYGKAGIGDLSLGGKFILFQEKESIPDIVGTLEIGAPTGEHPYSENFDEFGLGFGHWSGAAGITAIKSCDPAVIYGGINYVYILKKNYNGQEIQPGGIFGYNFGSAFLINDKLTLGAQIIGNYQAETKIDSEKIFFSSAEPIALRNSITYALSKNIFIEPSVIFGLNDDASDVSFNFSYSRRF